MGVLWISLSRPLSTYAQWPVLLKPLAIPAARPHSACTYRRSPVSSQVEAVLAMLEDARYALAFIIMMGGSPALVFGLLFSLRKRIGRWPLGGWPLIAGGYAAFRALHDRRNLSQDTSRPFYALMYFLINPLYKKQGGRELYEDGIEECFKGPCVWAGAPHPPGLPLYRLATQHSRFKKFPNEDAPIGMGARILFRIPVLREVYQNFAIEGSEENFNRCILAGRSVTVLPGGVPESLLSKPGKRVKIITYHTGFIRLALLHGIPVAPNFGFGDWNLFEQAKPPEWVANIFNKWTGGWYPTVYMGEYFVVPKRCAVIPALGRPVPMPLIVSPTPEEVRTHAIRFYTSMRDLIEKFKVEAGYADIEVEFLGMPQLNINVNDSKNEETNKQGGEQKKANRCAASKL